MITIITSIDITAEQLENQTDFNGYKCYCQAWSATGGTLKSRTATIERACKCPILDAIEVYKRLDIYLLA